MKWGIITALAILLACLLALSIFLINAESKSKVTVPSEATANLPASTVPTGSLPDISVTRAPTAPPTEPMSEDEPFQGLPPIGSYDTTPEEIAPEILESLQAGGLVFYYEAVLPDAPESMQGYRYTPLILDNDALLQLLFGTDYRFEANEIVGGVNGNLTTQTGTYYVLLAEGTHFCVDWENGAVCRSKDALDTLHTELSDLLGITLEVWRTGYDCFYNAARTDYAQTLGGIPISDHTYYIGNDEATGHGTTSDIHYNEEGLLFLNLNWLTEVEPSEVVYTNLLSAEDALRLVQARMRGRSVNAVQVFKTCRLVYLNPPEAGAEMIPAWELRYDFYTLDPTRERVTVCTGDFAYLVNAVDGTIYSYS